MKKLLSLLGILLIVGLFNQASAITIDNESFEASGTGTPPLDTLADWTEAHGGRNGAGVTNPDAVKQSISSTSSLGTVLYASEGENFAELVGNASISQLLTWNTGDELIFDWAFFSFDEQSVVGSFRVGTADPVELADTADINYFDSTGPHHGELGWSTYTYNELGSAGTELLTFAIAGAASDSILLIDNIRVSPVPEPATMLLFGLGLLGIAGAGRKKA